MAELTPVDELRKAVQVLRCDHRFPIQPPEGSLAKPGRCGGCGIPWRGSPLVADELIEPLADLLDETANVMDWLGPVRVRPYKDGATHWDSMGVPHTEWDRALVAARSITGGDGS